MSHKAKPCSECHEAPKWNGKHRCYECWLRHQPMPVQVEAAAKRREAVAGITRARVPAREWPAGRRWCSGCQSFRSLRDVAPGASRCRPCNSATSHAAAMSKRYGVSGATYAEILKIQGGRCGICRGKPVSKRLALDHDHATGEPRGALCSRCNHDLLGAARDSPMILQLAIDYLTDPPTSGRWQAPD